MNVLAVGSVPFDVVVVDVLTLVVVDPAVPAPPV